MATTRSEPQKENGSTAFYHHTCIVHTQSTMVGFSKIVSRNYVAEMSGLSSLLPHCAIMKVNEKKIEQVPIPLPKAASSLSEAKKMKKKFLSRWTSEIIQFIRYLIQMDRTKV